MESADGSERISGHTLRVTGAQGLARLGLELWAIQLFGRWGSEAVKLYVRLAPLERAAFMASRAAQQRELADVVWEASASQAPPATLVEAASDLSLDRWAETVKELAEPLAVEVETASPLPEHPRWVRNEATRGCSGIYHICSESPAGIQQGALKTRCGWRYGGIATVVVDPAPPRPLDFYRVCLRCAPTVSLALWKEFRPLLGKTEK